MCLDLRILCHAQPHDKHWHKDNRAALQCNAPQYFYTPLLRAASRGHIAACAVLVRFGANLNASDEVREREKSVVWRPSVRMDLNDRSRSMATSFPIPYLT